MLGKPKWYWHSKTMLIIHASLILIKCKFLFIDIRMVQHSFTLGPKIKETPKSFDQSYSSILCWPKDFTIDFGSNVEKMIMWRHSPTKSHQSQPKKILLQLYWKIFILLLLLNTINYIQSLVWSWVQNRCLLRGVMDHKFIDFGRQCEPASSPLGTTGLHVQPKVNMTNLITTIIYTCFEFHLISSWH